MSRLVILLGPVAASLGGVALGSMFDVLFVSSALQSLGYDEDDEEVKEKDSKGGKGKGKDGKGGKGKEGKGKPAPTFGKQKKRQAKSLLEELSDMIEVIKDSANSESRTPTLRYPGQTVSAGCGGRDRPSCD